MIVSLSETIVGKDTKKTDKKRCVCETQMPPIIANSKGGHGFTNKYLQNNINIFSQVMTNDLSF